MELLLDYCKHLWDYSDLAFYTVQNNDRAMVKLFLGYDICVKKFYNIQLKKNKFRGNIKIKDASVPDLINDYVPKLLYKIKIQKVLPQTDNILINDLNLLIIEYLDGRDYYRRAPQRGKDFI